MSKEQLIKELDELRIKLSAEPGLVAAHILIHLLQAHCLLGSERSFVKHCQAYNPIGVNSKIDLDPEWPEEI